MRVHLIKLCQSSLTRGHGSCALNWWLSICHHTRLSGLQTRAAICPRHRLSGVRCRHTHVKAHLISLPASYLLSINKGSSSQLSGQVLFTCAHSTAQTVSPHSFSKYSFLPSAVHGHALASGRMVMSILKTQPSSSLSCFPDSHGFPRNLD